MTTRASLDDLRTNFARQMMAASHSNDPRLERAFELVPREAFLPPPPWHIAVGGRYVETPSGDPAFIYQNVLVALDAAKGINNGEPFLHARWIGAVSPRPGEDVAHIGAGMGYYSAILSVLVLPGGSVIAYEVETGLAEAARQHLEPFENATVVVGDATRLPLAPADVIYVNAGVVAPPVAWLRALRLGGRMIFPWQPSDDVGLTLLVTRWEDGYRVQPLMRTIFIPCVGADGQGGTKLEPTWRDAMRTRSLRFVATEAPDRSATAIYRDVWFSEDEPGA